MVSQAHGWLCCLYSSLTEGLQWLEGDCPHRLVDLNGWSHVWEVTSPLEGVAFTEEVCLGWGADFESL